MKTLFSKVLLIMVMASMVSCYNITQVSNIYKSYSNYMYGGDLATCTSTTAILQSEIDRGEL